MRPAALWAAGLGAVVAASVQVMAAEAPKYGGTLTFMIPADSPPSFDAQREETYATIHSAAPFYSTLIRINPDNPGSTTDIVCDLCTEMPKPTDDGKTYTFTIRDDVKFHNGDKLTAEDVAASLNKIAFPPAGTLSPRSTPGRSNSRDMTLVSRSRACATPITTIRGCPILTVSSAFMHRSRRCSLTRSAPTGRPLSFAAIRPRRSTS
jgi:ABC-type transport system substrate-binding protein